MRECLACEKQFDESDEGDLRKNIPSFDQNTYCSYECYEDFQQYLGLEVKKSKDIGLISAEGQAIQSAENNPDVVRRIIGNLNIKLRSDK